MTRMHVKSMGTKEKTTFELTLSLIKREPLYRLDSCNAKCVLSNSDWQAYWNMLSIQGSNASHRWQALITDGYRLLIRKRQRAHMRGGIVEARYLRNQVNRATAKLKFEFFQTRIEAMHNSSSSPSYYTHFFVGSMYDDIRLHVARSYTSSADSPFSLMSSFTLSNHIVLGLPLFLLPCTFITIALLPT